MFIEKVECYLLTAAIEINATVKIIILKLFKKEQAQGRSQFITSFNNNEVYSADTGSMHCL